MSCAWVTLIVVFVVYNIYTMFSRFLTDQLFRLISDHYWLTKLYKINTACVAPSAKRRINDLDVTGSRPPAVKRQNML